MCVKLIKDSIPMSYDPSSPLKDQIDASTIVLVNYQPNDEEICSFLKDVQHCASTGQHLDLNLKVDYGYYLDGFKVKKQLKKALSDISLNEIIKLMALSQSETDRKLSELSSMCYNREIDGRK